MFPAKFAYAAPTSLQEAVGLLEDPEAKILAGGHSLLPLMKLRLAQPKVLVEAVHEVGDPQVRAKGTLAGALAHADPAGDLPAVVLALGGSVRAVGPDGERDIDLDGFFVDMLTTSLQEREIIREVRLRAQPPGSGAAYQKFDQPASHYALTGVCAVVALNGGTIGSARIGVTGVGPKAYRPTAREQAPVGPPAGEEAIKSVVQT